MYVIVYESILHVHYDMFRPVIAAIIGYYYNWVKGRTEVEFSPVH